jgi:RNA polymerase sigma factor (sigma-70 family)
MAKQSLNGVLQHLRNVAAVQTYHGLSDRDLLERFALTHDEAAFTVLIERHGPMVLGVCRRALPNFHDAEDACQATFLVLARKAASVRKKTSLSSWLHGVACRVAANLKRDHARRKARERGAAARCGTVSRPCHNSADPAAEVSWREVQAILDEELERLPERYRAPLILCYLECLTRDEAAQQLGLSSTTLHGRLERARDLLRERLTQRGLTLGAVMSAAALGESVAQAALAPTFVVSSTKAALLLAAGQPLTESVVAANVLALTQEVLKTMFLTKLKLATAAVLCAGLFVVLIGGSFSSLSVAQDAKPKPPDVTTVLELLSKAKTESDADFIRRISKDLRGTAPTPTEIHFFVASKDAGRRQKLIDLFIQERQAKKGAESIGALSVLAEEARARVFVEEAAALRERILKVHQNPTDLKGVIEKIDPKDAALLSISIGSDAGLAKGHTFDVYRLKPAPLYLGKIRIIDVSPQKAVARRVGSFTPDLKVGDYVTSSLTAPAQKEASIDFFPPSLAIIVRGKSGMVIAGKGLNHPPTELGTLQKEFYKGLHAAKEKGDVAKITQAYLDRLIDFVKTNPRSQDAPDAMRQIVFVYESQGKTVEAGAWRDKLLKEHSKTSSGPDFGVPAK